MEAAPRARTTDFGKGGVAADIFRHRAHKVGYGKWVMERMQKNNTCFCKQRKEAALCNLSL